MDFSGLPITLSNTPNGTFQFVFLHCQMRHTIATHEIRSDGNGSLFVEPNGNGTFRKQGNLNPPQTGMLLSAALQNFQASAGPAYPTTGLGTQTQVEFIFGKQAVASVNLSQTATPPPITTLAPQPLSNISVAYTRMAEGAAKVYMTGALGTAYVPGRISKTNLVFNSSLPYVIVSTLLFSALSLVVVIAHFRSGKEEQFTLFGVAAALHGSEIPAQFARMKADEGLSDEWLIKALGDRKVSMTKNADGSLALRLT
jgi:hypothetical protein